MKRSNKFAGRWSKANRSYLGVMYSCPKCNNNNAKPLKNREGKPYCSNCLVNSNDMVIMAKREMYSHYQGRRIRN